MRLRWLRKKLHSSRRFLLILGKCDAPFCPHVPGNGVGRQNCIFPVSFPGISCPVCPIKKRGGIADRVQGFPVFLYGFGIIPGQFLPLLFVLFLLAGRSVKRLLDVVPDNLKLPDAPFRFPVSVISGVHFSGKLLDLCL